MFEDKPSLPPQHGVGVGVHWAVIQAKRGCKAGAGACQSGGSDRRCWEGVGKLPFCLFLFTDRCCSGAMKPKHLSQLDGVLTSHPGVKGSRAFFQAGTGRQAQVGTASSPKPFSSPVHVLGLRGTQGLEESVEGW